MSSVSKDFEERSKETGLVIETVVRGLWEHPAVKKWMIHVQYGYETHIPPDVRERLRYLYNATSRYIRFAPDFFVLDTSKPDSLYLLEYKCTRTPLYSERRIEALRRKAQDLHLDWPDIGQWEASAFDNYKALWGIGVRVAVLNYCPYHSRPLVCDFVDRAVELGRFSVTTNTATGSRTPFVNLDLRMLRSLDQFLADEHGLERKLVKTLCDKIAERLQAELPVTHHRASPFSKRTG